MLCSSRINTLSAAPSLAVLLTLAIGSGRLLLEASLGTLVARCEAWKGRGV